MESQHMFNVYHSGKWLCWIVAHTKWEAVDKVYYKLVSLSHNVDRKKMKAVKVY